MDRNYDTVKKWVIAIFGAILFVACLSAPTNALSLKMQPLLYKDTLKQGEKKKGFVDISNPAATRIKLKTSVQAFRQINDKGGLQFYDEPQVSAGIKMDLNEFELGPREAIRVYFLIDGTKLPSGDVFAALFVSTVSDKPLSGTGSAVRLGTLLSIVNGTPGSRSAEITEASVPFWQFGDTLHGHYSIKNMATPGQTTGFFPEVAVSVDPFRQHQQFQSKLVFAGHTRQNDFLMRTSRFGLYRVTVSYGNSSRSAWVFMVTEASVAIGAAIIALIIAAFMLRRKKHRRNITISLKSRGK